MWKHISEWSKNKIFVSHVNAHQSVTSAEEDFDNQFYRVTHFGYTSQPLSPGSYIIAQWAQKQNGHDGRLCMGSVTGFHSQRLIWPDSHCWMINQPAVETDTESPLWHHSSGQSASYQICGLISLDGFHHKRGFLLD